MPFACRRPGRRPTPTAGPTRRGKLPDDTWVLRPQEDDQLFSGRQRYVVRGPRLRHVQGTDRPSLPDAGAVLERIIRVSSHPGDLVLDPFAGSGTTLATAKRSGPPLPGHRAIARIRRAIQQRLAGIQGLLWEA